MSNDFHKDGFDKGYNDGINGQKKRAVGAFDFGKLFSFVLSDSNRELFFRGYNAGYEQGLQNREKDFGKNR